MIIQFSIYPLDTEHMAEDISEVTEYLDAVGVEHKVGPIGTSVQGEWAEIMPVIWQCHEMIKRKHARVLTTITIDDHPGKEHTLDGAIEAGETGEGELLDARRI